MARVLSLLVVFGIFLVGCGGEGLEIPGLFTWRFINDSSNLFNADIYVFENSTGQVQSVNNVDPLVSVRSGDPTSDPIPFAAGTFQITLTAIGSKAAIENRIFNLDSEDSGTVRVVDTNGGAALSFP